MKATWLTKSGLLFENSNIKILVDPAAPAFRGMDDAGERFEKMLSGLRPNVVLVTHEHPGHLDADVISALIDRAEEPITFLAPYNAYKKLKEIGRGQNYVMLNRHSVWSERGVTFYAVTAEHSDRTAAGFIIDDGEKTYYASGDTLYNYDVIDDVLELVEDGVNVAFLPINGRDNSMNAKDASDFAYEIGASCAVPVHYGAGEGVEPESFDFEDTIILKPFEKYEF